MGGTRYRLSVVKERHPDENIDAPSEITITGSREDIVRLGGALLYGMKWVRLTAQGELQEAPTYKDPPEPQADGAMARIWDMEQADGKPAQMSLLHDNPSKKATGDPRQAKWSHNSIYVQALAGYLSGDGARRAYAERSAQLTEAGFSCLRSRRGDDGKYWEIWFLPAACCGEGPIGDMKTTEEVVSWLTHNVNPGSISVEGCHWGLVVGRLKGAICQ